MDKGLDLNLCRLCGYCGCLLNGLLWNWMVIIRFLLSQSFQNYKITQFMYRAIKEKCCMEIEWFHFTWCTVVHGNLFCIFNKCFCARKKYLFHNVSEGVHCFITKVQHNFSGIHVYIKWDAKFVYSFSLLYKICYRNTVNMMQRADWKMTLNLYDFLFWFSTD